MHPLEYEQHDYLAWCAEELAKIRELLECKHGEEVVCVGIIKRRAEELNHALLDIYYRTDQEYFNEQDRGDG